MTSKLMPEDDDFYDEEEKLKELGDKNRTKLLVILGILSIGIGIGGYIIAFVI